MDEELGLEIQVLQFPEISSILFYHRGGIVLAVGLHAEEKVRKCLMFHFHLSPADLYRSQNLIGNFLP